MLYQLIGGIEANKPDTNKSSLCFFDDTCQDRSVMLKTPDGITSFFPARFSSCNGLGFDYAIESGVPRADSYSYQKELPNAPQYVQYDYPYDTAHAMKTAELKAFMQRFDCGFDTSIRCCAVQ